MIHRQYDCTCFWVVKPWSRLQQQTSINAPATASGHTNVSLHFDSEIMILRQSIQHKRKKNCFTAGSAQQNILSLKALPREHNAQQIVGLLSLTSRNTMCTKNETKNEQKTRTPSSLEPGKRILALSLTLMPWNRITPITLIYQFITVSWASFTSTSAGILQATF